jgi:hypothetical protein
MVLNRLAGAEILKLEHLADFDLAILVMRMGERLIHAIASSSDWHCRTQ